MTSGARTAAGCQDGGSTGYSGPVLPPSSPRQSLGVGDGVDTPPPHGVSPTDGGAGCPQAPGSAIPFDHLAAIGLSPEEAADNCYTLTAAQAADLRAVLRGWR